VNAGLGRGLTRVSIWGWGRVKDSDCGDRVWLGKIFEKSAGLDRVGDKLCRNG